MTAGPQEEIRRAIVENPADDAPRRAWADLLRAGVCDFARGEELADFVAVQLHPDLAVPPAQDQGRRHLPSREQERAWGPIRTLDRGCACSWCVLRRREEVLYAVADVYFDEEAGVGGLLGRGESWQCRRGLPMKLLHANLRGGDVLDRAGRLFSRWPLVEVAPDPVWTRPCLLGGMPYWFDEGHGWVEPYSEQCVLPHALFALLDESPQHGFKAYEVAADAWADLSRACVRFGRQAAGLPELSTAASIQG